MGMVDLEIDASDMKDMINKMREVMKPQQFENAMAGIFRKTGRHIKVTMGKTLPKKYSVTSKNAKEVVGNQKMTNGAGGVGVVIPLKDTRKGFALNQSSRNFASSGGLNGWATLTSKPYRIKVKVLKGKMAKLPARMPANYGGQPPFRNTSARKPGFASAVFTRTGKGRFPIRKVTAIAIPQMPMNRSKDDVQQEIKAFMEKQMEDRFNAMLRIGK